MNIYTAVPSGEQVVQELPWRWKVQGRIFVIGGLGFMFDAWDVTLNGILIPLLSTHWASPRARPAGWHGKPDRDGPGCLRRGAPRRHHRAQEGLHGHAADLLALTVLGAFSPDFLWFCVFRFMAGFGLGGCIPVDYALVGEFTPRKQRGRVLTAMDGWWPVGAAFGGFVSAGLVAAFADWRLTMLVMVLPALLVFWVRRSVPESPLFLIRKGRREEAARVIDGLVEATGAERRAYSLPGSAGRTEVLRRQRVAPASPRLAVQLEDHHHRLGPVHQHPPRVLPVPDLDAADPHRGWVRGVQGVRDDGVDGRCRASGRDSGSAARGASGPQMAPRHHRAAVRAGPGGGGHRGGRAHGRGVLAAGVRVRRAGGHPGPVRLRFRAVPHGVRGSGFGWASTFSRLGAGFGPLIFANYFWPELGLATSFALAGGLVLLAVLYMAFFAPETRQRRLDVSAAPSQLTRSYRRHSRFSRQ